MSDIRLTAQPQLPLHLGRSLKLIVWGVLPLQSAPPPDPQSDRINGLGDAVLRLLLAPVETKWLRWGVGPAMLVPSATRQALGAGAFGLGGAGTVVFQGEAWTGSLLVQHLRSVSESAGRKEVQRSVIRPTVAYTTPNGVNLGLDSESRVDWESPEGERWSVPIQATLGQVSRIGGQSVNLQLGGRARPVGRLDVVVVDRGLAGRRAHPPTRHPLTPSFAPGPARL